MAIAGVIGWMYSHFAITNYHSDDSAKQWYDWFGVADRNCFWLAETFIIYQNEDKKRLWAPLQAQLLPMWVVAVLIGQWGILKSSGLHSVHLFDSHCQTKHKDPTELSSVKGCGFDEQTYT